MADHPLLPPDDPEEAEEALSLCDLVLHDGPETDTPGDFPTPHRQSSSDVPEFFEFCSDFSSNMCSADDVIIWGKLAPFSSKQCVTNTTPQATEDGEGSKLKLALWRRSESLSKLQDSVARSNSVKSNHTRNCKSLDYGKLKLNQSSLALHSHETTRNSATRSAVRSDSLAKRTPASRPRWYMLTFGQVKSPVKMELWDMKKPAAPTEPVGDAVPSARGLQGGEGSGEHRRPERDVEGAESAELRGSCKRRRDRVARTDKELAKLRSAKLK